VKRYVNEAEKGAIELARQLLAELAQESLKPPEAMPARCMVPFLAYVAECGLAECAPCAAAALAADVRWGVIFEARAGVLTARRGA
jgi:hypothetical protein